MTDVPNFFDSTFGIYEYHRWRGRRFGPWMDRAHDLRINLNKTFQSVHKNASHHPIRNLLVVGVEVPSRSKDLKRVMSTISQSRHNITTCLAPLQEGLGKFQNINAALKEINVNDFDWMIIVDDDISFPDNFIDNFIYLAETANLQLCQPAHKYQSYQSFEITLRKWNSLVRITHYVESGPVTAFRRSIIPLIFPFPDIRWAWGTDIKWSEVARENNFRIGIVDATPIRHLRPVGMSYSKDQALEEGKEFLKSAGIVRNRQDILKTVEKISHI